jgi:hypothetical protein
VDLAEPYEMAKQWHHEGRQARAVMDTHVLVAHALP